jgi:dTDP-4-dehydrorhamnose reductase
MPKALVLGGESGLLGQALVAALEASGKWEVTAGAPGEFDYFARGLSDILAARLDSLKPDCVFNAAAYTDVEGAEEHEDKALTLNRGLPAVLAGLVKSRPVRLVHFSTDFVFDGRKNTPYTTDDPPCPLSAYGRTKLAGEQAILEAGLSAYNIIRTAWLFGRGRKNFVRTILELCQGKKDIPVVSDQTGSPTYALDLAQHSLTLVDLAADGLFHIVNGGQGSWCELAGEALNYCQMECRVTPVPSAAWPSKVKRPAYSVLDVSRFAQLTGQVPRAWPQALRAYLMLDFTHGA